MKKTYKSLAYLLALVMLISACQKNQKMIVTGGAFDQSSLLTASTTAPILADSIKNDTAIVYTWPSADFGAQAPVNYVLQLDIASDTVGDSAWAKAVSYTVGSSLRYGLTVQDFNTVANNLGATPGTPGIIVARVKARVLQNTGTESAITPTYSNTVSVIANTYSLGIYVPNSYQGWNPATAPTLNVFPDSTGIYEGYIYLGDGATIQQFKYTVTPDFDHTNYGDGGGGTMTTDPAAAGMSVPSGGYYQVTANFKTNTWSATKTTWSILGDASPGSWTTDTQMEFDSVNKVWKLNNVAMIAGAFKFRANGAWNIDYTVSAADIAAAVVTGSTVTTPLEHANDGSFQTYNSSIANITITTAGNYNIVLDLRVSGHPTYSITKL